MYEYACHEGNTAVRNYVETSRYEHANPQLFPQRGGGQRGGGGAGGAGGARGGQGGGAGAPAGRGAPAVPQQ
jgi:hypothetical protein